MVLGVLRRCLSQDVNEPGHLGSDDATRGGRCVRNGIFQSLALRFTVVSKLPRCFRCRDADYAQFPDRTLSFFSSDSNGSSRNREIVKFRKNTYKIR